MTHRILFAGTPDIAVPLLKALARQFEVVGVLTACDKPQGRSKELVPPAVKTAAIDLGIEVFQYETLRTQAREELSKLQADTLISFAYGRIFGPKFLSLFDFKFNVHPSRLPQFRGPSPIQYTILNGLRDSCISLQNIGLKMDEGEIWDTCAFKLNGTETTDSLTQMVSENAADFVPSVINRIFSGELIQPEVQKGEASYCSMIGKELSLIDFNRPALEVHSKIRALYPWPKAYANRQQGPVMFTSVWGSFEDMEAEEELNDGTKPGTVCCFRKDRGIGIACSDKILWVTGLQIPGKKELDFKSFMNGNSSILDSQLNG